MLIIWKKVWSLFIKGIFYMKRGQMELIYYLQRCHLILIKLSPLQHLVYFWRVRVALAVEGWQAIWLQDQINILERNSSKWMKNISNLGVVAALQGCLLGWAPTEQRPEAFDWFPATNTLTKERMINVQWQGRAVLYSPSVWLEF